MARNWDSISNIFLKISFLSDKSYTYVLMVLVSYNIMARAIGHTRLRAGFQLEVEKHLLHFGG